MTDIRPGNVDVLPSNSLFAQEICAHLIILYYILKFYFIKLTVYIYIKILKLIDTVTSVQYNKNETLKFTR